MSEALHFHVGRLDEAKTLVERDHYSHRVPSNIQCVGTWHRSGGLFGDYGETVAACIFSIPGTRWSEEVYELCRLVRSDDGKVALSGLIAATVDFIKRSQMVDLLVSFADFTQGHHGGVYQASSWNYAGKRERRQDGLTINGSFFAGRSCNHRWGTRSPSKLAERLAESDVVPHWDEGKYLYWRALNKTGRQKAARLGLACLPYPKPTLHNVEAA